MHAIRSTILFVAFSIAGLVLADDGPIFGDIGNKCASACILPNTTSCAVSDASCLCKSDFNTQVPLLKCVANGCNNTDVQASIAKYAQVCDSFNDPSAAAPATPTQASQFSLPGCANKCINRNNYRGCSAIDVKCVCESTDQIAGMRCMFNECGTTEAAAAFNMFAMQCGNTTLTTPESMAKLPLEALSAASAATTPLKNAASAVHARGMAGLSGAFLVIGALLH